MHKNNLSRNDLNKDVYINSLCFHERGPLRVKHIQSIVFKVKDLKEKASMIHKRPRDKNKKRQREQKETGVKKD